MYTHQPPTRLNEEENQKTVGRALLQVMLWLGRDGDQRGWTSHIPDGDYSVYAETVSVWGMGGVVWGVVWLCVECGIYMYMGQCPAKSPL